MRKNRVPSDCVWQQLEEHDHIENIFIHSKDLTTIKHILKKKSVLISSLVKTVGQTFVIVL